MQFRGKSCPVSCFPSLFPFTYTSHKYLGCVAFALADLSGPLFGLPLWPEIKFNGKYYIWAFSLERKYHSGHFATQFVSQQPDLRAQIWKSGEESHREIVFTYMYTDCSERTGWSGGKKSFLHLSPPLYPSLISCSSGSVSVIKHFFSSLALLC